MHNNNVSLLFNSSDIYCLQFDLSTEEKAKRKKEIDMEKIIVSKFNTN